MWEENYKKLPHQRLTGYDSSMGEVYGSSNGVEGVYVKGNDIIEQTANGVSTKFRRIYHTKSEVSVGDKYDGHVVKEVKPCYGAVGGIEFWKVWVV